MIGSVPVGLLIAKAKKVDIRSKGSGNTGATNVYRTLGLKYGVLVGLLDAGKGFAAAWSGMALLGYWGFFLASAGAVTGHSFSLFLGLKGGKSVATGFGCLFFADWRIALLAIAFWAIAIKVSSYVSFASIAAVFVTILLTVLFDSPVQLLLYVVFTSALIIVRHTENIKRLKKGNENSVRKKERRDKND